MIHDCDITEGSDTSPPQIKLISNGINCNPPSDQKRLESLESALATVNISKVRNWILRISEFPSDNSLLLISKRQHIA